LVEDGFILTLKHVAGTATQGDISVAVIKRTLDFAVFAR
jgi:hypothetical protein